MRRAWSPLLKGGRRSRQGSISLARTGLPQPGPGRLEPYFWRAVEAGRRAGLDWIGSAYEVSFDHYGVAGFSKRIRAGSANRRKRAAGPGEAKRSRWLHTTGYSRR